MVLITRLDKKKRYSYRCHQGWRNTCIEGKVRKDKGMLLSISRGECM